MSIYKRIDIIGTHKWQVLINFFISPIPPFDF